MEAPFPTNSSAVSCFPGFYGGVPKPATMSEAKSQSTSSSSSSSSTASNVTTTPVPKTPKILQNIIRSLDRLLPQVGENGLLFPDKSTDLWDSRFWKGRDLKPSGKAKCYSKKTVGVDKIRPTILATVLKGWGRDGVHRIDAGFWFEKFRKYLISKGGMDEEDKLTLRSLCEIHGCDIVCWKPQVFQRNEMRQYNQCKVLPNHAKSSVQLQCPWGHDCKYVKEVSGTGAKHAADPLVLHNVSNPTFFLAHQYECHQCLTGIEKKTAPPGTTKTFFGHLSSVAGQLKDTCKPSFEFVDDRGTGGTRVDNRLSSALMRRMFGDETVKEIQRAVKNAYLQSHVDNERMYRKFILDLRACGKINNTDSLFPPWKEEPTIGAPSLSVLEGKFERRYKALKPHLDRAIASVSIGPVGAIDATFAVVKGLYGQGKGACASYTNHLGQIAAYAFMDTENWDDIALMMYMLFERMTDEERRELKYIWTDTCCRGSKNTAKHPLVTLFEHVEKVYLDNMHAQKRLTKDLNLNHTDFAEFNRDKRSWFWEAIPTVLPVDSAADNELDRAVRNLSHYLEHRNINPIKNAHLRMQEIQKNSYYWKYLPLMMLTNSKISINLKAGKEKYLNKAKGK